MGGRRRPPVEPRTSARSFHRTRSTARRPDHPRGKPAGSCTNIGERFRRGAVRQPDEIAGRGPVAEEAMLQPPSISAEGRGRVDRPALEQLGQDSDPVAVRSPVTTDCLVAGESDPIAAWDLEDVSELPLMPCHRPHCARTFPRPRSDAPLACPLTAASGRLSGRSAGPHPGSR